MEVTNGKCIRVSAHRRIPVEILETIFSTLCSFHEYSFDLEYCSESPLPAIVVSHVCSHWRIVARESPRIWSSIRVNLDLPVYDAAILNLYLSNSKAYPLKLRIVGAIYPSTPSWCLDIWTTLSRHVYKSRELILSMGHWDPPPIQQLTFPNLESYSEEGRAPPDQSSWPWFWQAIKKAPKLTMVSSYSLEPSFSRLRAWEIRILRKVDNFLDIAKSCRCLSSLTLSYVSSFQNTDSPATPREVILPYLRQLSISTVNDELDWLSSIIQSLIVPSLETCHIQCQNWPLPSGLLAMVQRSSTTLKRITFTAIPDWEAPPLPDPVLFDILDAASEMTHFELSIAPYDTDSRGRPPIDDMISTLFLKLRDDYHTFLPKLNFLSLTLPYLTLNTQLAERIFGVVSARQLTPHPMTKFCVSRMRSHKDEEFVVEPEVVERMKLLEESGVKVVIEVINPSLLLWGY